MAESLADEKKDMGETAEILAKKALSRIKETRSQGSLVNFPSKLDLLRLRYKQRVIPPFLIDIKSRGLSSN